MDKIEPMEPILSDKILQSKDWIHQIKWDGIRGLSYISDQTIKVLTKKGFDRTSFYPELHHVIRLFKGKAAILDGEMVVFDNQGRPSFSNILVRERVRSLDRLSYYQKNYPVAYIVFDILHLDGEDLRSLPLRERKQILVNNLDRSAEITITDDFEDGSGLFDLMKTQNFEGIVSKNLSSAYYGGKKHDKWFKVKMNKKILTVVGGIVLKDNYPSSLKVGIYRNDQLEYIGNVSSGLRANDYQLFQEHLKALKVPKSPFTNLLKSESNVIWIQPVLTCWVQFMEWTSTGSLRHPKIIGFSPMSAEEAHGKEFTND